MKILVCEFFLAGLGDPISKLPPTLLREARAMASTLLQSLATDPALQVRVLLHPDANMVLPATIDVTWTTSHPLIDLTSALCRTDMLWPIAPETEGRLKAMVGLARRYGVFTLSPEEKLIEIATDKWLTYLHLKNHRIPTPETVLGGKPSPGAGPWIVKPRDGVGSLHVRLVQDPTELPKDEDWVIQSFCPGRDISQVVVGGAREDWYLPPCSQILMGGGSFEYLGGETPLDPASYQRSEKLARTLIKSIGAFRGWLGIDMVLGHDPSGKDDKIIEVNPRLTTSFVGLNRLAKLPLGPAVVNHAFGRDLPLPGFGDQLVRFQASGEVEPDSENPGR